MTTTRPERGRALWYARAQLATGLDAFDADLGERVMVSQRRLPTHEWIEMHPSQRQDMLARAWGSARPPEERHRSLWGQALRAFWDRGRAKLRRLPGDPHALSWSLRRYTATFGRVAAKQMYSPRSRESVQPSGPREDRGVAEGAGELKDSDGA